MKWILYSILTSSVAGGAIWAASVATTPATQEETEERELEEFEPTEKVPVDSSISFPVDI